MNRNVLAILAVAAWVTRATGWPATIPPRPATFGHAASSFSCSTPGSGEARSRRRDAGGGPAEARRVICRTCNTNHPGGLADTPHVFTAIPRDGRIRVPWVTACNLLMVVLRHDYDAVNQLVGVASVWIARKVRTA